MENHSIKNEITRFNIFLLECHNMEDAVRIELTYKVLQTSAYASWLSIHWNGRADGCCPHSISRSTGECQCCLTSALLEIGCSRGCCPHLTPLMRRSEILTSREHFMELVTGIKPVFISRLRGERLLTQPYQHINCTAVRGSFISDLAYPTILVPLPCYTKLVPPTGFEPVVAALSRQCFRPD